MTVEASGKTATKTIWRLDVAKEEETVALAVDIACDRDAWNSIQGFGDVGVRELADVFGKHRIRKRNRRPFGIRRIFQAGAITGHHDRFH